MNCSVDGCESKATSKGWCPKHYQRWKRLGSPDAAVRIRGVACVIADCDNPGNGGHGWCEKHYRRWQRHGDPMATSRIVGDDLARFWSYVQKTDGCWLWTGGTSKDGYGILGMAGRTTYMPRFSYELEYGPIPEGQEPDHLCRVRLCVRPDHLEPVTHTENVLRGVSPPSLNYHKTHCIRGHEFTPENTYVTPCNGGRNCRTCMAYHAERRQARRAAARVTP